MYCGREFRAERPQRRAVPLDLRHGGGRQGQRLYRRSRHREADTEVQADLRRATIGGLPGSAGTTNTVAVCVISQGAGSGGEIARQSNAALAPEPPLKWRRWRNMCRAHREPARLPRSDLRRRAADRRHPGRGRGAARPLRREGRGRARSRSGGARDPRRHPPRDRRHHPQGSGLAAPYPRGASGRTASRRRLER